jgi:hypothetical protein
VGFSRGIDFNARVLFDGLHPHSGETAQSLFFALGTEGLIVGYGILNGQIVVNRTVCPDAQTAECLRLYDSLR